MRTVGVLGGMGPAATVDFMAKVYAADPAEREQDRVRLIVDCDPGVLDRNAAVRGEGPSPGPDLAAMAGGLVGAGADFLVIACNTAHAWTAEIETATGKPVLSMIEAVCEELARRLPGARRIGVLAGDGCLAAGLYQNAFAARGWSAILPGRESQAAFMAALYRIKSGALGEAERAAFIACANETIEAGAEVVVAGCTEVPLLLRPEHLPVPLIDSSQALAARTIAYAKSAP
ncbi:MAG: aspartate/glutamate racemase family protein [Caulobacteraceae bacterium]